MLKLDGDTLDRLYNNRALVSDAPDYLQRWAQTSAVARQQHPGVLDLPYGSGPSETLDIFPAQGPTVAGGAPVMVLIHGGYWRALDKSDHSFVAPAYTQEGVCVVVPNYALCPAVTVPQIVMQMVRAVAWTWRNIARYGADPQQITLVGHSVGGHMAAMLLACVWKSVGADLPARLVRNALSISGLYELESLRRTPHLKPVLRLTPAQALKASPAWMPSPGVVRGRGVLYSVAGGDESAAFLHHNRLIAQTWGRRVVPVCEELPGLNHFSIMSALAQPGSRLHALANELLLGARSR